MSLPGRAFVQEHGAAGRLRPAGFNPSREVKSPGLAGGRDPLSERGFSARGPRQWRAINILWCSIRGRGTARQVFAGDLAPCKTEYSTREDLLAAGSCGFYFTNTLKNLT
jgi:hypothetical protein